MIRLEKQRASNRAAGISTDAESFDRPHPDPLPHGRGRSRAAWTAALAGCVLALLVRTNATAAGPPISAPVTDATVLARVASAATPADHRALAAYYKTKSTVEAARIDYFDQLLHAYMKLEGKMYGSMQRQARQLLKGARMARKYFDQLSAAHLTMANNLSQQ